MPELFLVAVCCAWVSVAVALTRQVRAHGAHLRERAWPASQAWVLSSTEATPDDQYAPTRYRVRARLRTVDGAELEGEAREVHLWASRAWVGTMVPAWYDPRNPQDFTLVSPRVRGADLWRRWAFLALYLLVLAAGTWIALGRLS